MLEGIQYAKVSALNLRKTPQKGDELFNVWSTNFDPNEFPIVFASEKVRIQYLEVLTSTGHWKDGRDALRDALQDDLIIVSLSGHNPRNTVRGLMEMAGKNEWRQRKAKVVLRTQDSHHQIQDELAVIDDIDLIAIAHKNYLRFFPPHKVLHIPCSLYYTRSMAKEWLGQTPTTKDIDVMFPFQLYRGEPRNTLAYEVLRNLKQRGMSARFGFFRYFRNEKTPPLLWEELARARVILNLPLRDDFNIRNLEASLFPSCHLTPKLPDHDTVQMDWSNTRFVEPNARQITRAIEDILQSDDGKKLSLAPREKVLQHHTANDRIYQITDSVLGTTLREQPKVYDAVTTLNKKPAIVRIYNLPQLLGHGPTLLSKIPSNAPYKISFSRRFGSTALLFYTRLSALITRLKS